MSIAPGTTLGSFEISGLLGVGGMGEVYRARDTKLGREVAVKVLPEVFAQDADRLARFEREAKLLAALNHPNIAGIYEIGHENETHFLVMELVEGGTLADRIGVGAIPFDEALALFAQIAEALEFAHGKGVIHRDLKPANIKVTEEGTIKILDFGLAKAFEPDSGSSVGVTLALESAAAGVTGEGKVLGTPAYMSPEQARGQTVDKQTDIWAFGCCLYEALTARRPFQGPTATDLLADIIKGEPDWNALPPGAPRRIRDLLWRCLQKDPRRRLRDIGDAWFEIGESQSDPSGAFALPPTTASAGAPSRSKLALTSAATFVIGAALSAAALWFVLRPGPGPLQRYEIAIDSEAPVATNRGFFALSRDGRRLAYMANVAGVSLIYVRRLDEAEFRPLAATEGAQDPFFSPDGEWIGFDASSGMKAVRFTGGPARQIWSGGANVGRGTWGEDDTITIDAMVDGTSGLYRIPAAGGEARLLAAADPEKQEIIHRRPGLLPDGKGVLASIDVGGSRDEWPIALISLPGGESKRLGVTGVYPRYAPSGHLLYVQGNNLWAVPFDLKSLELAGTPVPVVESVAGGINGRAAYAFSDGGTLIYLPGGLSNSESRVVWVDREGNEEIVPAQSGQFVFPRLSADGRRLAFAIGGAGSSHINLYDLGSRRPPVPVTFADEGNYMPVWSPDGARLVYARSAGTLYSIPTDLSSLEPRVIFDNPDDIPTRPSSFSPDGGELIFYQRKPDTGWNILGLSLDENSEPRVLVETSANELQGRVSSDGRWLAYTTDISGRKEIRIRPYPESAAGAPVIVSVAGGEEPVWRGDGRELFYLEGQSMMAVAAPAEGETAWGEPQKLFDFQPSVSGPTGFQKYDAAPDGSRFITIEQSGAGADDSGTDSERFIVLLNWFEELKRLAPRNR